MRYLWVKRKLAWADERSSRARTHGFGPETEALERLVKYAIARDGKDEGSKKDDK
jgi:hypothetical protein